MVRVPLVPLGSSPPSSTEATHFGTPSTNITVMSQEECPPVGRVMSTPRSRLRINTQYAQFNSRASLGRGLRLPPINTVQLSPMAEEFTPQVATFASGARFSPVLNLVADSTPDFQTNGQGAAHGPIGQLSPSLAVIEDMNLEVPLSPSLNVAVGTFSTDENVTRTFQIYDRSIPSLYHIIHQFPARFDSLAYVDSRHIGSGIVRINFHDDRDTKQAYVLAASLTHPHCEITLLTAKDIAAAHGKDPNTVSNYEGQVLVTVMYNARSIMPMLPEFYEKLIIFGDVKAIVKVHPVINNAVTFRVEYHDATKAKLAAKHLPQASYANVRYLSALYEPDIYCHAPISAPPAAIFHRGGGQPSMTGRTTLRSGDFARLEPIMARVMREPPSPHRGIPRMGHNVVDIGRIESGLDVRTTVMLRNIPNKLDQEVLKNLLDVTSLGYYDFMYLRIDFANNCNVGYAFINFVDPLAIIPFARARAGRRWNIHYSDKVAEISYATIQGRDCLVQKFRNSSVMLEDPTYRPVLFHVHPSPLAGQEEEFPDPDNFSKMKRSVDNAEHVGLFTPRRHALARRAHATRGQHLQSPITSFVRACLDSRLRSRFYHSADWTPSTSSSSTPDSGLFAPREGQAHREEQRRRRSQFDRGTPGAEIELSSYRLTDAALDCPGAPLRPSIGRRNMDGGVHNITGRMNRLDL